MNKTKKQIIVFMIIVLIGISYTINEFIISPQKLLIEQKSIQIQADKQKLILLKNKSAQVEILKAEVEKLKQSTDSIGEVTVADIDTPQLIFDFYSSCTEYGIQGDNLVFQLTDSNTTVDNSISGPASNSSMGITNPSIINNKSDLNNMPTATTDLLKLTIELKVSGDKNRIEKYIRNLGALTERKINVKSIKLEATETLGGNNLDNGGATISTPNTTLFPGNVPPSELVMDKVTAHITFNQYVYSQGKDIVRQGNYSFYNESLGFSNFSDMFK